jgi:Xaa-Pro aminopeptidase
VSVALPSVVPDHLVGGDGYPRFTPAEMGRRRDALLEAARDRGAERVLLVGADRSGSAVQWVTGWPVTREAYAVVESGERDALFVNHFNHVPLARQLALDAAVGWAGPSGADTVLDELRRRRVLGQPLGVIGPLSASLQRGLTEAGLRLIDLNPADVGLRLVKSDEEIEWLRVGAALSDAGIAALTAGLRSGLTEWELADLVERAYVPRGGTTHIHYFGVTPMDAPSRANPSPYPSFRRVRPGDAVVVELSAAFWGYPGQVLRSFAVESEPTPLYRELHAVATAAFDAICGVLRDGASAEDVIAAAKVIEDAGFTTVDDLVHGFGGGYLPPILGSASRDHDRTSAIPLRAGMTVVVQPNVVTPDGRAGVQTGELLHVTADGFERLHRAPRGFVRVG